MHDTVQPDKETPIFRRSILSPFHLPGTLKMDVVYPSEMVVPTTLQHGASSVV